MCITQIHHLTWDFFPPRPFVTLIPAPVRALPGPGGRAGGELRVRACAGTAGCVRRATEANAGPWDRRGAESGSWAWRARVGQGQESSLKRLEWRSQGRGPAAGSCFNLFSFKFSLRTATRKCVKPCIRFFSSAGSCFKFNYNHIKGMIEAERKIKDGFGK